MTRISDWVTPRLTHTRSINVERHRSSVEVVDTYIPTGRAVEAIDRIVTALEIPGAPRAWTITGPYGSGKSAFAAFLTALLGPRDDERHRSAIGILSEAAAPLADRLREVRIKLNGDRHGFVPAVATAQREPATDTIVRALLNGAEERWSGRGGKPAVVRLLRTLASENAASAPEVISGVDELLAREPTLIVLDEFGKNLEFAADDPSVGDLFILQQIAERLVGDDAPTGLLITFQHLSFTDYAHGLPATRLQEWNKVQGRFDDLSFLEAHDQTAQLVQASIEVKVPKTDRSRIRQWAKFAASTVESLELGKLVPTDPERIAAAYPVHPLGLAVLPELTARYGQHERSLFGFLTADEPHSLRAFLETEIPAEGGLPLIGLDELYDFFIGAAADVPTITTNASRWIEIRTRLRESQGLPAEERSMLKTIGLLNLVSSGGPLRASRLILEFVLGDSAAVLRQLEERGVITYRGFADEYRIWEGSDVNLPAEIAVERERAEVASISDHLAAASSPAARIAQRHAHQSGTLRFFEARYVADEDIGINLSTDADGLIIYLLGDSDPTELASKTSDGRPVVYATTSEYLRIRDAAVEAAALTSLLASNAAVRADRVALQEARHRAGVAQAALRRRLEAAYDPLRAGVQWVARGKITDVVGPQALSSLLSDLCDESYSSAPVIRNEMLNRQQLTSQGAKARRLVLEGMIERSGEERFGITGYGPEATIYDSVLATNKIHTSDANGFALRPPSQRNTFYKAWKFVLETLRTSDRPVSLGTIVDALGRPPFGMRSGVIPVLTIAVLATHADEIAIYQDGSFEPVLSADLAERMIKIPSRVTLRYTHTSGRRESVINYLRTALDIPEFDLGNIRNATLLSVIRPMVATLRTVPKYGMRTTEISAEAQSLRTMLTSIREPDELIFQTLPTAVGVAPFASDEVVSDVRAKDYAGRVTDAMLEIVRAYPALLDRVASDIGGAFDVSSDLVHLREDLRARSRHLAKRVLDQQLRSFLLFAVNDELGDVEWLEALAMNLAGNPPKTWRDPDYPAFQVRLGDLVATFRRVELLYFSHLERDAVDGFSAQRLTLTLPDGSEIGNVVWVDDSQREAIELTVDEIIALAEARIGPDALQAILAELAQRLLTPRSASATMQDEEANSDRGASAGG